MKILDEDVLDQFRGPGRCELCGKQCRVREPHHLWGRGLGGEVRIDLPINLISLGSTPAFQCQCHSKIGAGLISREYVLEVVAKRESRTPDSIREEIWKIRRTPKP